MDQQDAGRLQPLFRAVLTPGFRFLWRVRTEGLENIPEHGPAILAPNHTSVLDSFFVPLVLKRRMTYVGKAEYLDDWKTKWLFPAMGMIPIDRSGGDASKGALDAAAGVLDRGELFGIYPEGTRSRSGKLHKGHTGVARLALRCKAPIIPVGIVGTVEVQPPDAKIPKAFREVTIRFGKPIDVTRYCDRASDRMVLRQITDEVMYSIRDMSGQEYVDTYATKQAAGAAKPATPTPATTQPTPIIELDPVIEVNGPVLEPAVGSQAAIDATGSRSGATAPKSSAEVLRQSRPLVDLTI
ncbi:MAG: lysophospholipid acyltransferase family protein [Microthrixaceae bacterium]